ncbi:MAG: substrate-binding domain-containing protein [Steroidobacteraceae bacterium]|nr:substrate-binding domain-containing protein [Steroidobacteraceae bacterium]
MSHGPLRLISSMATREVLRELATRYQEATKQAVVTEAAGGVDVAKRVQAGEAVDIVVLASNVIDKLIAEGKLLAGSRVDIVKSGVAVAVRAGAARPDISTEQALKQAVLSAKSLSYSTGPSGTHLEKTFERWGILDQIRSRIVVPPPGVPVGSLVACGQAELGFQQLSELMNLPGIEVVGPLPPPVQTLTIFSGGISVTCSQPDTARAVLAFMGSPDTAAIKQRHGMDGA